MIELKAINKILLPAKLPAWVSDEGEVVRINNKLI